MKIVWRDITDECEVKFQEHGNGPGYEISVLYPSYGCFWSICNGDSMDCLGTVYDALGYKFRFVRDGRFFHIELGEEEDKPFKLGDKVTSTYIPRLEVDHSATIVGIKGTLESVRYVLFNGAWTYGHDGNNGVIAEGCRVAGFSKAHWFARANKLTHKE